MLFKRCLAYIYSMMTYIWSTIILSSIAFSLFYGNADTVFASMLGGIDEAISLCFSLCASYMLWMGLLNIAQEAGLIDSLSKLLKKPLSKLFPKSEKAVAPITLNLTANFLGMGSAATPFGLMAMKELKKEGNTKDTASDDMCMFLALNSSAIELLPTTVISLRLACGSQNAYSVLIPTFIASVVAFSSSIFLCKLFKRWEKK